MALGLLTLAALVGLGGILYQFVLQEIIFVNLGLFRTMQPLSDFPYSCRRITHPQLQGCEDHWLDETGRTLYAACAGSEARVGWNPAISKYNVSARRPQGAELVALSIDEEGEDGFFGLRVVKPEGYVGVAGDSVYDLLGFDVEDLGEDVLRFWFVNQRPPVGADGKFLDATVVGVNATVDVFDLKRGEGTIKWVKTVADENVFSPNNIALLGEGTFAVTNDHSGKIGWRKELDPLLGGGNVAYCPKTGPCSIVSPTYRFPNGLIRGNDGLVYVPAAAEDAIRVFLPETDGPFKLLDTIKIGMPIDNLAVDSNGDIFAAGVAKTLTVLKSIKAPFDVHPPSSIWRITKSAGEYKTEKLVEDRDGEVVAGITTATHDVKTGRLFMGGFAAPYLVVCNPK